MAETMIQKILAPGYPVSGPKNDATPPAKPAGLQRVHSVLFGKDYLQGAAG